MNEPTAPTRVCSKCGTEKALTDFAKASWCKDGRRGQCKACRLVGGTVRVAEKVCNTCEAQKPVSEFGRRTASADGYLGQCRECRNAARRARYPEQRDAIQESIRAWRAENPEKVLLAASRWAKANRTKRRDQYHRRRALLLAGSVGHVDLDQLWTGYCALCGLVIDPTLIAPHPLSKSVDHIVPLSLGGSHEQSNLQWTHLRCNIRKGARPTA